MKQAIDEGIWHFYLIMSNWKISNNRQIIITMDWGNLHKMNEIINSDSLLWICPKEEEKKQKYCE